jgi:hypothetical protein
MDIGQGILSIDGYSAGNSQLKEEEIEESTKEIVILSGITSL